MRRCGTSATRFIAARVEFRYATGIRPSRRCGCAVAVAAGSVVGKGKAAKCARYGMRLHAQPTALRAWHSRRTTIVTIAGWCMPYRQPPCVRHARPSPCSRVNAMPSASVHYRRPASSADTVQCEYHAYENEPEERQASQARAGRAPASPRAMSSVVGGSGRRVRRRAEEVPQGRNGERQ